MAFVVAGQLAKDAFDQIILQQLPDGSRATTDASQSDNLTRSEKHELRGCCPKFLMNCCGSPKNDKDRRKKIGDIKRTATMNLTEFVSIVSFNARHTKILAPTDG